MFEKLLARTKKKEFEKKCLKRMSRSVKTEKWENKMKNGKVWDWEEMFEKTGKAGEDEDTNGKEGDEKTEFLVAAM